MLCLHAAKVSGLLVHVCLPGSFYFIFSKTSEQKNPVKCLEL